MPNFKIIEFLVDVVAVGVCVLRNPSSACRHSICIYKLHCNSPEAVAAVFKETNEKKRNIKKRQQQQNLMKCDRVFARTTMRIWSIRSSQCLCMCCCCCYFFFNSCFQSLHGVRRVCGMFWCAPIIPYGNMLFNLFESNGKPFGEKLCNRKKKNEIV